MGPSGLWNWRQVVLTDSCTLLFAADVDIADGNAVITLYGELDLTVRSALREQLAEIAENKPDVLVIDLAAVTFLDCGTAVMMIQASRILASGRKPVLRDVRPQVRRLLELTGWTRNASCPHAAPSPRWPG
jgi:anti-anti-sigma factor